LLSSLTRKSLSSIQRFSKHTNFIGYIILITVMLLPVLFVQQLTTSETPNTVTEEPIKIVAPLTGREQDKANSPLLTSSVVKTTATSQSFIKASKRPVNSLTTTETTLKEDIVYNFSTGLLIENLVLKDQRLVLLSCTNAVIRNVTVNTSNWGIILEGCYDILMVNCTVIDGIAATEITNLTIQRCTVSDSEYYFGDIGMQMCNDVTIRNSTLISTIVTVTDIESINFTGNSVHIGKIDIQRCSDVTISDNIMAPFEGGIYVLETDNITITNNTIDSNQGTRSIRVSSSTNISIENNSLSRAYSTTIYITSCSLINITGNDINITGVGIYIVSANSIVITDNKLSHLSSYSLSCRSCIDFLFSKNLINSTGFALHFGNDSKFLSKNIEITGNRYWNITKNFSYLSGEITHGPGGLYVHDNYLDGMLFDGIPGVITTTTTTTITTTNTTVTSSTTSETIAIPVIPFLLTFAGNTLYVMIKRRGKKQSQ